MAIFHSEDLHVEDQNLTFLFFGAPIATKRFFDTLNKIERKLNESNG